MSTSSPTETATLNRVLCFNLDVHIWSGRRKLKTTDIGDVEDLPNAELASLGSKKVIDTEHLKVFNTLKKRAQKACESRGVRFLGGYAIPVHKARVVADELDAIKRDYAVARQLLVDNYDQRIQAWKAEPKNASWAHIIENEAPTRAYVEGALDFNWQTYKVQSAVETDDPEDQLAKGLKGAEQGLAGQLFREIAMEATDFEERTLSARQPDNHRSQTREFVTQRAIARLRAIREKMEGLSFLDPCVRPIIETIDYSIKLLPESGKIDGPHLATLWGLTRILKSPERMRDFGRECLDSGDVAGMFSAAVGPQFGQAQQQAVPEDGEAEPPVAVPFGFDRETNTSPAVTAEPLFPALAMPVAPEPGLFASIGI